MRWALSLLSTLARRFLIEERYRQLVALYRKIVAAIVEGIGKAVGKVFEIGANIVNPVLCWEGNSFSSYRALG
jgi:hypothetical protein